MTKITPPNIEKVKRFLESGYSQKEIEGFTGFSKSTVYRIKELLKTPGVEKIPQDKKNELLLLLELGTPSQKSRRKERKYILKAIKLIKKWE